MNTAEIISSSSHPLLAQRVAGDFSVPNVISTRAEQFLEESKLTAPASNKLYRDWLWSFVNFAKGCGITDAAKIDQSLCRQWFFHLLGTRKVSPSTLAQYRTVLGMFIKFLKEAGYYVGESPLEYIRRVPFKRKPKRPFTRDEMLKLLSVAPSMKQCFWSYGVMTAYHTGLRLSDVAMLRRDAIDWEKELIRVVPIKTKRSNVEVLIPIEPTEFYPFLKKQVDAPVASFYQFAKEYVCPEMACERMKYNNTRNVLSGQFKFLCAKAGLPEMSFHKLRDTFASRLMNSGNDAVVVASMTGHQDLNILKGYVHVNEDRKRAALLNSL